MNKDYHIFIGSFSFIACISCLLDWHYNMSKILFMINLLLGSLQFYWYFSAIRCKRQCKNEVQKDV